MLRRRYDQSIGQGGRLRTLSLPEELFVQSVDLARLIGRNILHMQGPQLVLSWLVIVPIVNRPWSRVKLRSVLCKSDDLKRERAEERERTGQC